MVAYIAFEGGEGSGKSTQAARLAERLDAVLTREPGGTELGGRLRSILLDADGFSLGSRAEALMMAADRAQHLDEVIGPALAAGRHVVSDRSAYSSLAYQGVGRGLGVDEIRALNDWATDDRWPDLVVLLDVSFSAASSRLERGLDRIERAGDAFHRLVAEAFTSLAAREPDRWLVVDGSGTIEEVERRLWAGLEPRLDSLALSRGGAQ